MSDGPALLVVANARAGSFARPALEAAVAVLREERPIEVVELDENTRLDDAVRGVDGRTVVAVGGDGTLHLTLAALDHAGLLPDVPVGLIPLGTGNDFARMAGIPLDPQAAARFVLRRPARCLDLMDVHGETAVNAVHFGLGVSAAKAADGLKMLGPLAYTLGGVAAGLGAAPVKARISVDGAVVADGEQSTVAIVNGFSIGGGNAICPPARPDDGKLDVVTVEDRGRLARLGFGAALRRGAHLARAGVCHRCGSTVEVEGEAAVTVNTDGELRTMPQQWMVGIRPQAWWLAGGGRPEAD